MLINYYVLILLDRQNHCYYLSLDKYVNLNTIFGILYAHNSNFFRIIVIAN